MDTLSKIMADPAKVYSQKETMCLLQKIFDKSSLESGDISSLNGAILAGTVDVDIKHQQHHWSEGLYEYLGIHRGIEVDHGLFLSFVAEEDRQELRSKITEGFDGLGNDKYSFFKIRTGEGRVASVLAFTELTTNHDGEPESLHVEIFDVSDVLGRSPHRERLEDHLSSKWLNRVFENPAIGIFILNGKGQFLRTNQTYQKLAGYTVEELKQLTFLDTTPKDQWEICQEKMAKLLAGELESFIFEKQLLAKSGDLRWVEVNCTVIDEESFYVLCFLTDIHDKKIADKKSLTSEEQLYEAQKIAKIGSWEVDLKTMQSTWSKGMYDLMETSYDYEPEGESVLQFIHPEDQDLIKEKLRSLEELKDLEIRHVTTSGMKHILINSRLEKDEVGTPVRYYGTSQDISERRFEDKKHELVQNTAKLGWWEADLLSGDDHIWSDMVYELLELDKGTTRPSFESYLERVHPEDRKVMLDGINDPEILKNGWHNKVTRILKTDGTYRYILDSGYFVWDGDRPVRLIGTMMDISETKAMQAKIEEAQEIARLGWWEVDLLTGKTNWSSAIFDILELDPAKGALPFEEYAELLHPEDRPLLYRDPATLKDGWENVQIRYRRKCGGYTHTIGSGKVIFDGDKPVKMIGTNMDITSLKQTQTKLQQAQKIAKVGWWEFDMTGKGNNWYSPEHMEIMGIDDPRELMTFDDFYGMVYPDDVVQVKEIQDKAIPLGGWTNLVHRIITKSGELRYVTSNASIEFEDKKPVRLLGSIYDITDIKEIEVKLSENLINLEAMVKSMDNMVLIVDDQLKFREVFCKNPFMLGTDMRKTIGMHLHEGLDHFQELLVDNGLEKGKLHDQYKRVLKGEVVEPLVFKLGSGSNTSWYEAQFHTFKGQDGKAWLAETVNDITARKKAEEELVKTVQKERELSEMRSEFVSMASHQFRTPLTVIKANMQLLELSDINHPVIEKVTKRLDTEVDRLVSLMEDIMAMGKVQSNNVEPNFKPLKLSSVLHKIKLEVESQQKDQRLLEVSISGEETLVHLDEQFIEHALHNLIDNAFKYSPNTPNPRIHLYFSDQKVSICVRDFGIGIPKKDQARLFNSFQRASNSQHIQGTGLGLAVAKEFVRLNRGTIFLNDQCKKGTEFCVNLPLKPQEI